MASISGYKKLLIEAKRLVGQAGLAAYDRATLLNKVFEDPAFRADTGAVDDYALGEVLDAYVSDLAVDFMELKNLLDHFPNREAWGTGNLKRMRVEMIAARREASRAEREQAGETITRTRRTHQEFKELEHEKDVAERQLESSRRDNESLVQEVARLKKEAADLRIENAQLTGRITELERVLKRELAGIAA